MDFLEKYAAMMGITRRAGEDDECLKGRLMNALSQASKYTTRYQRVCLVLWRLGIKSARRHLPAGVA